MNFQERKQDLQQRYNLLKSGKIKIPVTVEVECIWELEDGEWSPCIEVMTADYLGKYLTDENEIVLLNRKIALRKELSQGLESLASDIEKLKKDGGDSELEW